MKRVLFLLLTICGLFAAGCSGGETVIQTPDSSGADGEFIINDGSSELSLPVYSFDTFNPVVTKSESVLEIDRLIYEPLFEIDENMNIKGVLASGYTVSSDGLRVDVFLNEGVRWHDGSPFSAEDVDYTVKALMGGQFAYSEYLKDVSAAKKDGSYRYSFTLKRPVVNFPALLVFPIVQDDTPLDTDSAYEPVGTGPYRYNGKSVAKEIMLSASSNWSGGQVGIQTIKLSVLKDRDTAISAFEAGGVDCLSASALNLGKYTPKRKMETAEYVSNDMTYIGINYYNSIFWGESTRQALCYLTDKDAAVQNILYGRGEAADVPVNPSAWYYEGIQEMYSFDAQKARELIAADGWVLENGVYSRNMGSGVQPFKIEILTNSDSAEKSAIAYALAKAYSENGISASVKAVGYAEYTALIKEKKFDMFIGEIALPYNMDPSFLLSAGNYFTYANSQMDELINNLGRSSDEALKQAFVRFSEFFAKDVPFIPLFFRRENLVHSSAVAGGISPTVLNPYYGISGWYISR